MNRSHEQGNILWFILIAVVLLAGLTAVISRGGSSVEQSGDIEQLRLQASHLMRYAKSIETAVQEMQLRGVSENDISFENNITATDYTNAGCTDSGCMIFDVGGAGLTYRNFENISTQDWIFTGANNVGTASGPVGTTGAGTGNDLVMLLPGISSQLCIQINRDLDIGTPGTIPEDQTGIATTEFTGAFPGGAAVILDGDPAPFELDMQNAGCFTAGATNYFYYVVLAR